VNGNERPFTRAPFRKRHAAAGLVVDRDFSKKELLDAIASLKTGKAAGIDEIPSEILRLPPFTDLLLRFSNDYLAGEVPLEVLVTRLVLVPKKGDKSIVENYRGIAIISVFLKLINRMLLHRLRVLDTVLRYGQNGFRPGRSTSSHVMALSLLAELDLPFAVLFVDFAKAFDSVSFAAITAMLDAFCVPHRLMSAVLNCYRNHAVWVGADGSYQLKSGVLQGDTLVALCANPGLYSRRGHHTRLVFPSAQVGRPDRAFNSCYVTIQFSSPFFSPQWNSRTAETGRAIVC
jgi:hypothetical protein